MMKKIKQVFFEDGTKYAEKLQELHIDLPILPEWKSLEKVEKLFASKTEYVAHVKRLKQPLNHGLILKKGSYNHYLQSE